MNNHYTYFLILALSLAGPLALSFDKKVAFYKKWKYVFAAMILPAIFYIVWDGYFAGEHIWFFNENYIATKTNNYNLPIEEILFFFVVPYCCTFVYECVCTYFPKLQSTKKVDTALWALGFILVIVGFLTLKLRYTAYTSLLLAIFIFIVLAFRKYFISFNSTAFLAAYAIILIPYFIVNGFLTAIPVVTYNDTENLATRIYTIPIEDAFYGMLLVMMNIVGYEKLLNRTPKY
jgi:lycopene cyclase domain-containing protein